MAKFKGAYKQTLNTHRYKRGHIWSGKVEIEPGQEFVDIAWFEHNSQSAVKAYINKTDYVILSRFDVEFDTH
jgi:hypothetical protein